MVCCSNFKASMLWHSAAFAGTFGTSARRRRQQQHDWSAADFGSCKRQLRIRIVRARICSNPGSSSSGFAGFGACGKSSQSKTPKTGLRSSFQDFPATPK